MPDADMPSEAKVTLYVDKKFTPCALQVQLLLVTVQPSTELIPQFGLTDVVIVPSGLTVIT